MYQKYTDKTKPNDGIKMQTICVVGKHVKEGMEADRYKCSITASNETGVIGIHIKELNQFVSVTIEDIRDILKSLEEGKN